MLFRSLRDTIRTQVPLLAGRRSPGSQFRGRIDDLRVYPTKLSEAEITALAGADPIGPILAVPSAERSDAQEATLRRHYLETADLRYRELSAEIAALAAREAELAAPLSTVMVMQDAPEPRMTYVLTRGNYASPDKERAVEPGTPGFLNEFPDDLPRNRYGLARWIVDPANPLTSRVAVNRIWQMLFGTGIVETSDDFGSLGRWPSHPELLDWLASDFIAQGWDIKGLVRQIVTSSTYRQSSRITPEAWQRDPRNRLLARGSRFRLAGEFIRDQALVASGLLAGTIGGPSVKPYQPPGLWNEVSLSGDVRFVQDHGDKLWRRSLYTYWKRSAPAPAMLIFDVPTREACVVHRPRTNTPLQALVTLNDTQFVEAARVLAERAIERGGATPEERATFIYRSVTSRRPSATALAELVAAQAEELDAYRARPDDALALISTGEATRNASLDAAEHAAWTIVASLVLNLDAALTRG